MKKDSIKQYIQFELDNINHITFFADRLKNIRLNKGITKKDLAKKIKVHKTAITMYEDRAMNPSDNTILNLSAQLDANFIILKYGIEDEIYDWCKEYIKIVDKYNQAKKEY